MEMFILDQDLHYSHILMQLYYSDDWAKSIWGANKIVFYFEFKAHRETKKLS